MVSCKPFRWIWGLLPLAIIAFLTIVGTRESVERDLKERAQTALGAAKLSWAIPNFDGRDGSISGTAINEEEQSKATNLVQNLWGVRKIEIRAKLSDKIDPYLWQISRKRNRIRLKGYVPSEEEHKLVLGMVHANFPAHEIDDRLQLGRGVPAKESWLGGISFTLKQLGSLSRGIVVMENTNISITGIADDIKGYERVTTALNNGLPAGVVISKANILPPMAKPYKWSVKYDKSGLALDGNIFDTGSKRQVYKIASENFSEVPVVDRTQLASGGPSNLLEAIELSLIHLSRLQSGSLMITGKSFQFKGLAKDENSANELRKSLNSKLPKSFEAEISISFLPPPKPVLPSVDPYVFSGEFSNGVLRLSGHIPSERARASILAILRATLPETRVVDDLQLGLGDKSESDWLEAISFCLVQLSGLKFGSIELKDNEIRIAGEAETVPKLTSVQSNLKLAVPSGFIIRSSDLVPPRSVPFVSGAQLDEETLVLKGNVPDRDARNRLLKFAGKRFPGLAISDRTILASGAQENWLRASRIGLVQLSQLKSGRLTINDTSVSIEGVTDSEFNRDKVMQIGNTRLPENYKLSTGIEVVSAPPPEPQPVQIVEADKCQELLNSELRKGSVEFKTASSELLEYSTPVLAKLAEIAKRCPDTTIEIAGYTDSDGSREFNKYLSQRRAESVVKFLENNGIPLNRLSASGFGEEFPKVPNDTEENKAKNRRIEFNVKG